MLDITVSVVNGLAVVGLKGALVRGQGGDHLTEVVEWLCEAGERRIAVHAAGVSAVDIDGLVALIGCHAYVSSHGGDLVIKMPSDPLRRALRRTGLDALLLIVDGRCPNPSSASAATRDALLATGDDYGAWYPAPEARAFMESSLPRVQWTRSPTRALPQNQTRASVRMNTSISSGVS